MVHFLLPFLATKGEKTTAPNQAVAVAITGTPSRQWWVECKGGVQLYLALCIKLRIVKRTVGNLLIIIYSRVTAQRRRSGAIEIYSKYETIYNRIMSRTFFLLLYSLMLLRPAAALAVAERQRSHSASTRSPAIPRAI